MWPVNGAITAPSVQWSRRRCVKEEEEEANSFVLSRNAISSHHQVPVVLAQYRRVVSSNIHISSQPSFCIQFIPVQ